MPKEGAVHVKQGSLSPPLNAAQEQARGSSANKYMDLNTQQHSNSLFSIDPFPQAM